MPETAVNVGVSLRVEVIVAQIQQEMEELAAIIRAIPGVVCHKSGDSNYYTLPTGHIVRLANHPSFDLAGQSADIYVQPRGDGRSSIIAQFVLYAFIRYDPRKRGNVCFRRKVSTLNFLTALADACILRKPTAYNPRLGG